MEAMMPSMLLLSNVYDITKRKEAYLTELSLENGRNANEVVFGVVLITDVRRRIVVHSSIKGFSRRVGLRTTIRIIGGHSIRAHLII